MRANVRNATPRMKVAVLLLLAVLVAVVPTLWLGWDALDDIETEVDEGRLRLAQLAATQADRVVVEAFFEIELMAQSVADSPADSSFEELAAALRTVHARASSFHTGVLFIDDDATVILEEPSGLSSAELARVLGDAAAADDRSVSTPWLDPDSGHVVSALGVPLYDGNAQRLGTMVGVLDLTEPLVSDLIIPASRLGRTGHADLVDERGTVLASTNPAHLLTPGDHPAFYAAMAQDRSPRVANVTHEPGPTSLDRSTTHVMAYAPLQNAPWGVSMGASEAETYASVSSLRRKLLAVGSASAITLLVGIGLAARLVPGRRREVADEHPG